MHTLSVCVPIPVCGCMSMHAFLYVWLLTSWHVFLTCSHSNYTTTMRLKTASSLCWGGCWEVLIGKQEKVNGIAKAPLQGSEKSGTPTSWSIEQWLCSFAVLLWSNQHLSCANSRYWIQTTSGGCLAGCKMNIHRPWMCIPCCCSNVHWIDLNANLWTSVDRPSVQMSTNAYTYGTSWPWQYLPW